MDQIRQAPGTRATARPAGGVGRSQGVLSGREGTMGRARLLTYEMPEGQLSAAISLGNGHCWVNARTTGGLEGLFATDIGKTVLGAISVRYSVTNHPTQHYHAALNHPTHPSYGHAQVQLDEMPPSRFRFHPAYQQHIITLPGGLQATDTFFLPKYGGAEPAAAYRYCALTNNAAEERKVTIFGYVDLCGGTEEDVQARFDPEVGALIAHNASHTDWVRIVGFTPTAGAWMTTLDDGQVYDQLNVFPLDRQTTATGHLFGALQLDLTLQPGETTRFFLTAAFSHEGEAAAVETYRQLLDAHGQFERTLEFYRDHLGISEIATPDPVINQGVQWSKANMLRVMGSYPQGPAFTNEPGVSSNVVGRDAAWFVYGCDYLDPSFSRVLIESFLSRQQPSGKIVEYYSALDGHGEDYGLNINDDTPLIVLAACHHYQATRDRAFLDAAIAPILKACDYMLSQRDERGLVWCTGKGTNVWGICGWRNVIPDYAINGAVTEINAECFGALDAATLLATDAGKPDDANRLRSEADALKTAVNEHLINPRNGMYYLTIGLDGRPRTDVTCDELFPVMFGVADRPTGYRIVSRLSAADFWTEGGLRTVSRMSPNYDPSKHVGLLGGVWPGVVFWYAFAAGSFHPEGMAEGLHRGYQQYLEDPRKNNTVPGQFSEWFDGESLVNRGMRLSPWEPPRYLWAAVEGLCGVKAQADGIAVNPRLLPGWKWLSVRRLPYAGGTATFFAVRRPDGVRLLASGPLVSDLPTEHFDADISDDVDVWDADVVAVAFRRGESLVVCLGNSAMRTVLVPWGWRGVFDHEKTYHVRTFNSEFGDWVVTASIPGKTLEQVATPIEAGGFRVLEFNQVI